MITKEYRYWIKLIIPIIVTIVIFLIIQSLITQGSGIDKDRNNPNYVDFIRIKQDDTLQERKRTIPDKPPTPKRPPQPQIELDVNKPPPVAKLDFEMPDFSLPTDFSGAFLSNLESMGSGISQLIPIVKVAPRCPREAQINGINGSVKMLLTISANGRVNNIVIQSFKPSRVFNSEAIKAVKRWQFKPKTIDGIAVDQKGELEVEFSCNV
ncbi:MAG: energy transducer TonB [Gammaproteobacteria bacterium]|nr:energy transducer TonB [Gammaproteobacteria bacterium]|tara:strand:- start:39 stop:668 length:630 start_codon:yes stop_codon:yes gene_type:complete